MIPVLVEIETETTERTGTVHPFCSKDCRRKFAVSVDAPADENCHFENDVLLTGMGAFAEDTVCAYCGNPIDDVPAALTISRE